MIRKDGKLYLTIKEYAEAASISHQAVYKQLQTRLQEYKIEVENQTYIDAKSLEKFYGGEVATEVVQVAQQEVEYKSKCEAAEKQLESQEEMIDFLKKEIQEKNKQIENLSLRLQEAIKSVDQEQQLHLVTQQKLLLIEKQEEEEKAAAEEEEKAAAAAAEEKKKSWFNKMFRRSDKE